jgi:hypothetical protein
MMSERTVMLSGAAYGEEFDFSRERIPDREEIDLIEDWAELWAMQDDYEAAIIKIETQLQYPDDLDRDWFFRARSALIAFRIGRARVERRLKQLAKTRPGPAVVAVAPEAA